MDLEEWEFLPDDGFLGYHEDGEKKILSSKRNSAPKSVFNMNYFMCPSSPRDSGVLPNHLVPVPIQLEPTFDKVPNDVLQKQITKVPIDISIVVPSAIIEKIKSPNIGSLEADQDSVSQVFFKKMKENEFVDMKMDSPKSSTRGIIPQIDAGSFNFDDKSEAYKGETLESINSPKKKDMVSKKTNMVDCDTKEEEITWEENNDGMNLWKWSLTGIGAICSFGVAAAATVCIIILGSHQRNKQHQQNQKLRFQIYTDDKRIKQVVHHATKLNEAISAVRGVPITRAQITFGGYYDGL